MCFTGVTDLPCSILAIERQKSWLANSFLGVYNQYGEDASNGVVESRGEAGERHGDMMGDRGDVLDAVV